MDPREIDRVLRFCREIDLLVTEDPGTSQLEVLEQARAKLSELVWQKKWSEAEELAYAILLKHAGYDADECFAKYGLC